ncbi:hypothetical protein [Nocardioides sp. GXQ0305]|uniref:hypothetical protein n=1 Tax=Nocardioides sp. GXQ0305 TaxID=3423912 RepID=UPI003D7CC260
MSIAETSLDSWSTRRPVRLIATSLIVALLAALAATFTATLSAAPAQALCAGPSPLSGSWRNIDANTTSTTRVELNWGCADQALCDENGSCAYPAGWVRVFGRCHPSDCDWGSRTIYVKEDGWRKATYSLSWATKHVWVRPYQYYGRTYLRVWVQTDFTAADGRQDYTTDVWMLKS